MVLMNHHSIFTRYSFAQAILLYLVSCQLSHHRISYNLPMSYLCLFQSLFLTLPPSVGCLKRQNMYYSNSVNLQRYAYLASSCLFKHHCWPTWQPSQSVLHLKALTDLYLLPPPLQRLMRLRDENVDDVLLHAYIHSYVQAIFVVIPTMWGSPQL